MADVILLPGKEKRVYTGHPWIFRDVKHYLRTGELLPPMGVAERVALAKRHYALSLEMKGVPRGVYEMRRHLSCYFKGLPDFKETRIKLVTSMDPQEIYALLDSVAERWGNETIEENNNVYGI